MDVVSFFVKARMLCTFMLCISTSVSLSLYSPLGREYKCPRTNSPLLLGNELDAKGVVAVRAGLRFGIGIADATFREGSLGRRL